MPKSWSTILLNRNIFTIQKGNQTHLPQKSEEEPPLQRLNPAAWISLILDFPGHHAYAFTFTFVGMDVKGSRQEVVACLAKQVGLSVTRLQ